MININDRLDYYVPSVLISKIVLLAGEFSPKSIHYVGYADAELLKSLKYQSRYELSIMDMFNRTNRSSHFWNDEFDLDLSKYPIPEWMDNISSYEEGCPDADLYLWDTPWSSADQFDNIVSFEGRNAPKQIILFGDADLNTEHPAYEWSRHSEFTIGLKKS